MTVDHEPEAASEAAPAVRPKSKGNDGLERVIGLAFIAAVLGGMIWLIHWVFHTWWGLAAVAGLLLALLIVITLPARGWVAVRVVLVVAALVGLVGAYAQPRMAEHARARHVAAQMDRVAPQVCALAEQSDQSMDAAETLIARATGARGADLQKLWVKIIREQCPSALSRPASSPDPAADTGGGGSGNSGGGAHDPSITNVYWYPCKSQLGYGGIYDSNLTDAQYFQITVCALNSGIDNAGNTGG
jgi:hypothetical protein